MAGDPARHDPDWDAVAELWWESKEEMKKAWRSPEGRAATADLAVLADLSHTTWAIAEEEIRR